MARRLGQLEYNRPVAWTGQGYDWPRLSLVATLMLGAMFAAGQVSGAIHEPYDFGFYWRATDFGHLYAATWQDPTYAYVYPPVLAQVLYPFHVLGHDALMAGWTMVCFASLWYCLREWTVPVIALGMLATLLPSGSVLGAPLGAVLLGNVQIPMAAAIVAGLRHPGWFAVPIVTKVTVGVGLLWYPFRREWRRFALGLGITALVIGISVAISPGAWLEYVRWTIANYGQPSNPPIVGPALPLRVVAGIALVWLAARKDWRWLVPIAGAVAIPSLYGWTTIVAVSCGAVALGQDAAADRILLRRV